MLEYTKYNPDAAREFIASINKKINRLTHAKSKEFLEELKEIDDIHIQEAAKDILLYSKLETIDAAVLSIIEQKHLLHDKTWRPKPEDIQSKVNANLDENDLPLTIEDIPSLEKAGLDLIASKDNIGFKHIKYVFETLHDLAPKSVANFIIDQTIAGFDAKKNPVNLPKKFREACKKYSSKSGESHTKNITLNIGKEKDQKKPTEEAKLIYSLNANDKFDSVYLPFFFGTYGVKEITENSIKQYRKLKEQGKCSKEEPFLMFVGAKKIANIRYSTSQRLKAIKLEDLTDKVQEEDQTKSKKESATEKKQKANIFLFEFADTGEGFSSDQLEKLYNRIKLSISSDIADETKAFKKTLTKGSSQEKHGEMGIPLSAKTFAYKFGGTFELHSNYREIKGKLYKDYILFDKDKHEFKVCQPADQNDYGIQNALEKRAKTYFRIKLTEHSLHNLDKIIVEQQKYEEAERPILLDESQTDITESSILDSFNLEDFKFPEEQ